MSMYKLEELTKHLSDKGLSLCGCIGAINGQPHCPCKMARLAKEEAEKRNSYDQLGGDIEDELACS